MSDLFREMLKSGETLFANPVALDYDYQPKLVPYREMQQKQIAACIKPLFQKRTGRNILVYGPTGVGKTAALRHILQELEEETDEIIPVYINCWQKNTTFKILLEMCDALGMKLISQNKRTDELFDIVKQNVNKKEKAAVFVFDEIDKIEDFDLLYQLLEEIYRKSIIMITNHRDWIASLDQRIKSRLNLEMLEFRPYSYAETKGILMQRAEAAFVKDSFNYDALEMVFRKTAELGDIRKGLYMMKEAGDIAEENSSRKITIEHVQKASFKLNEFTANSKESLDQELQMILRVIGENNAKRIGDIYKAYQENGGVSSYKTFQRGVIKLESGKFITTQKITGGTEGSTTIIKLNEGEKKLTEF